jgi:hypothetical protein
VVACDQRWARSRARTRRDEAQVRDGIVTERGVNIAASATMNLSSQDRKKRNGRSITAELTRIARACRRGFFFQIRRNDGRRRF